MSKMNVIIPDNLGKTIKKDEATKKWEVNVDNSTITVNEQGQLVAQGSGLDCAAIDELPIKPWKKDTTVLAKQDGECIRLKPNGDIFTDVVARITTEKAVVTFNEGAQSTADMVFMITNAGVNTATNVDIAIIKPALGNYLLGNPVLKSSDGVVNFTESSSLSYHIDSMPSGGVATITIPITYNTKGVYTFGLNVRSLIDSDISNNTYSISITANEVSNNGEVLSGEDCPIITATDIATGKPLRIFSVKDDEFYNGRFGKWSRGHEAFVASIYNKLNVFMDGIPNRKIRIENAGVVIAEKIEDNETFGIFNLIGPVHHLAYTTITLDTTPNIDNNNYNGSMFNDSIALHNFILRTPDPRYSGSIPTTTNKIEDIGTFDADTGIFTFSNFVQPLEWDYGTRRTRSKNPTNTKSDSAAGHSYILWVKPRTGTNCNWQCIFVNQPVYINNSSTDIQYTVQSGPATVTDKDVQDTVIRVQNSSITGNVIGELPTDLKKPKHLGLQDYSNRLQPKVITCEEGGNAVVVITGSASDKFKNYTATGSINISHESDTHHTITIKNPTINDSIKFDGFEIKIIPRG